ncbi:MAG TPA: PilN domain-containing protein [Pseudolabrys sp.]|nr:PilN domain-containing protein [Pseudolabrys sp.]
MDIKKLFAISQRCSARLANATRRLGSWWLNEFLDLIPQKMGERLIHRGRKVLVLAIQEDVVALSLQTANHHALLSEQIEKRDYSVGAIQRFLNSQGVGRADVDIAIHLPIENIFCRRMTLPIEVNGDIDRIVEQSLLKKTPFNLGEIYCDHIAPRTADGDKVSIWQWIVMRENVHQTVSHLQIGIDEVAMVIGRKGGNETSPLPVIRLNPTKPKPASWTQKSILALTYSAAALAFVAGGAKYWHQQALIDNLESEIAEVAPKAREVREIIRAVQGKQGALRRLRIHRESAPFFIDVWEEATRILPSNTWLTELRFVESPDKRSQQITMTGFSAAAPGLISILNKSSLFSDAALTAPVFLDPVEKVERFTLQTKVIHSEHEKKALHR